MSDELYLILHKVRGEPAFDIAIKMDIEEDDEPWWIIPTSGHRAYPYAAMLLEYVMKAGWIQVPSEPMPPDWPDHYQTCAAPGKGKWTGRQLLDKLGLSSLAKSKPFQRRF